MAGFRTPVPSAVQGAVARRRVTTDSQPAGPASYNQEVDATTSMAASATLALALSQAASATATMAASVALQVAYNVSASATATLAASLIEGAGLSQAVSATATMVASLTVGNALSQELDATTTMAASLTQAGTYYRELDATASMAPAESQTAALTLATMSATASMAPSLIAQKLGANAPVLIQKASSGAVYDGVTTSASVTWGTTPTAGNLLLAACSYSNASASTGPAGYTLVWGTGRADASVSIFYKFAAGNETTTSFSSTTATLYTIQVFEVSNIPNTGAFPFDFTSIDQAEWNQSALNLPAVTTQVSNEFVLAVANVYGVPPTPLWGPGMTVGFNDPRTYSAYAVLTTTQTFQPTFTYGATETGGTGIVVFALGQTVTGGTNTAQAVSATATMAASLSILKQAGGGGGSASLAPTFAMYPGFGGHNLTNVTNRESQCGKPIKYIIQMVDYSSKVAMDNNSFGYFVSGSDVWPTDVSTGRKYMWSVPLAFKDGSSVTQVAAGAADANYNTFFSRMKTKGHTTPYVRFGWEYNIGTGVPGYNSSQGSIFVTAFQRAVGIFRSYYPQGKVEWNSFSPQPVFDPTLYPGDAYVDIIGIDPYDGGGYSATTQGEWDNYHLPFLQSAAAFARAHGKKLGISEWGVGTAGGPSSMHGDNALYVNLICDFVSQNIDIWEELSYFDENNSAGNFALDTNPIAKAAWYTRINAVGSGPTQYAYTTNATATMAPSIQLATSLNNLNATMTLSPSAGVVGGHSPIQVNINLNASASMSVAASIQQNLNPVQVQQPFAAMASMTATLTPVLNQVQSYTCGGGAIVNSTVDPSKNSTRGGWQLWRHYTQHVEQQTLWLLKNGTVTAQQPYDETTISKQLFGGRANPVTAAEKVILEAAGYTVTARF